MNEAARILVVDDDESIRKSLIPALEGAGYVVGTAEDGTDAIKKAEANFYNLALIDIRLPDMEGTQLLSALKETRPKMVKEHLKKQQEAREYDEGKLKEFIETRLKEQATN